MRDHSIDTVRAVAIGGVVGGHWLVTGLYLDAHGVLRQASPLTAMPWLAPASWLFQTLGLFFFTAGFAAAHSVPATGSAPSPRPSRSIRSTHPGHSGRSASSTHSAHPGRSAHSGHSARSAHPGRSAQSSRSFHSSRSAHSGHSSHFPRSAHSSHSARSGRGAALGRLIRPVALLVGLWTAGLAAAAAAGVPGPTLRTIAVLVVSPLWFLLPYVVLTAATRPLIRLLDRTAPAATRAQLPVARAGIPAAAARAGVPVVARAGMRAAATRAGVLVAGRAGMRAVAARAGVPVVALAGVPVVALADLRLVPGWVAVPAAWSVPWILGVALARGRLRGGSGLMIAGVTGMAALILVLGYPASAVGVPGQGRSNLAPPSLLAVALAIAQIGIFLMVRPRLTRAHRLIATMNRRALPIYLTHQSVLVVVTAVAGLSGARPAGLLTEPTNPVWAAQRLLWLPVLAAVLVTLVALPVSRSRVRVP